MIETILGYILIVSGLVMFTYFGTFGHKVHKDCSAICEETKPKYFSSKVIKIDSKEKGFIQT